MTPTPHAAPAAHAGTRDLFTPRYRDLTLGLVSTITLVALEALAIGTVMPIVARDLGGLDLYGWVFSGFFLGSLIGIVVSGGALDRMPLRRPFAAGLLLFAAGLVLGGVAPSMEILVLARFLQGLGAGAIPPTAYVAIARSLPEGLRPRMFAMLSTAWVVPAVVGPAIAAVVGEVVGWRWVFLGLLPLLAASGSVALRALRDVPGGTGDAGRRRTGGTGVNGADEGAGADPEAAASAASARRLPMALVAAAGATILLGALTVPDLAVAIGGGVLGLVLLVPAFRRLTPRGTLSLAQGLPAAVLLRGVLTFGFFAADAYVALLLQEWRGEPAFLTALAFTTTSLAWSAGSWIQARGIERRGARHYLALGALVTVAGIVLSMPALLPFVTPWIVVATFALAGLGMGLSYAAVAIVVLREAPPAEQGSASAALQLSDILGTALGAGIGGAIIAAGGRAGGDGVGIALGITFGVAAAVMAGAFVASRRIDGVPAARPARTAAVD